MTTNMKKDENTRSDELVILQELTELRVLVESQDRAIAQLKSLVESQDRAIAQLKSRLLLYENIYEDLLSEQEETNNVNEPKEDRLQKEVELTRTNEEIKEVEKKTDDTAEALRERFESQKREYALFKSSFLEFQNKLESLIRNRKEKSRLRSALTIFECGKINVFND